MTHTETEPAAAALAARLAEGAPETDAGGDRPFLLDGDGAWLVRAGRVDVFAVPLRDGAPAGSRTHLFRVEAGGLLLGTGGAGEGVGLLAVGGTGTRVSPVERLRLRAAAIDPARAGALAALLDEWVDRLCAAVSRDAVPDGTVELEPEGELPAGARHVRPRARVAWVRHREGASLFLGREGLRVNGDFTPLSRRAWMEVASPAALEVRDTAGVLADGDAWDGLARLHALVLGVAARLAEEAAREERERLRRKAAAGRGVLRGAMARLAGTLDAKGDPARMRLREAEDGAPADDHLLAAARIVGAAAGVTIRPYPREKGAPAPRDPLAALARASRVRTRQVVLREGWWREDGGPLLGFLAEDGRPVALVPDPRGRYRLRDPRERGDVPVDSAGVADRVGPIAHAFYRPFADEALRLRDVVRFGLAGCGKDLARVFGWSAAAALLSLVTPIATGMIFNDIIPGAERGQLAQLTLALVVIAGATLLFRLAAGVALVRIEGKMGGATQAAVWDRVLGLPMPFFRPYTAGDLATRAMGIDAIRQQLSGATVTAVLGGLFSLVHFALLYHYAPRMAVWATGLILLSIAATALASRVQIASEHRIAALQARLSGAVLQYLSSIAKLRTAAAEGQAFALWARGFSEQRQLQFRARSVGNLVSAFNAGFPVIASLVLYAVALPLMGRAEDPLRTGDFMAFMSSFATCLAGMLGASQALLGAMNVVPLYEQARPILETLPEVDTAKADPGVLTGAIDIERVVFRYSEDGPPILRDVSMRIQPGEFVAFVGPSGSGKSTLLRLLLGFETPESGAVYYDGRELAGLDAQAVRRQIGVVLQNGRLMSGDIFTNIMGSTPGTQADAWEAARMAGFDEDIRAMPMGMHTVVSEGGGTLSGGQRQRLMIARAIVQRPRILFFDEATSALDNRTQAIVTESLDRLSATRVVIAHRLSTILHADRIFVIQAGRIVQTGTYAELIAQEGLFAELAKRQLA